MRIYPRGNGENRSHYVRRSLAIGLDRMPDSPVHDLVRSLGAAVLDDPDVPFETARLAVEIAILSGTSYAKRHPRVLAALGPGSVTQPVPDPMALAPDPDPPA